MPAYVNNLLVTQLNEADTSEANERIKTILDDINNNNISDIQVVDAKGVIRGENNVNNRSMIGQKQQTIILNRFCTVDVISRRRCIMSGITGATISRSPRCSTPRQ